jgi:beta-glucosidase
VPAATLQHGVLSFDVVVANTGALAGATALQLYVRTPDVPDSPLSTLVAFDKVAVAAGRTVTVTLKTGVVDGTCAFCLYSATGAPSVPVGTRYEVFVGNGAGPLAPIVNVTAS